MDHCCCSSSLCSILNNGRRIPCIGLGTFNFASSLTDVEAAILEAIKLGYRHIDTATYYGTEQAVGKALSQAFQMGLVRREDMFITSKLWCDDNTAEAVLPALQKSLSELQLDYLDLYLMHFPLRLKKGARVPPKEDDFLTLDIKESWQAMEVCLWRGLTKAIGVSNFTIPKLSSLLQYAEIVPAVNQVEMHPMWQQKQLREFCQSHGIHICAWSPLGAPGTSYGSRIILDQPTIHQIASNNGKTTAQVVLRWGIQVGASIIPKSFNAIRQSENLALFDWNLTIPEMESISQIPQCRMFKCEFFCNEKTSPYKTVEQLWDGDV